MVSKLTILGLALGGVLLTASPCLAEHKPTAVGRYWRDFKEFWSSAFECQSGVVLVTLAAGAVAMFIITRGKWKK
jgi:hypothetical protein